MLDFVTESWRTRRVKEEIGSFASISEAFGPAGQIHLGNPGLTECLLEKTRLVLDVKTRYQIRCQWLRL